MPSSTLNDNPPANGAPVAYDINLPYSKLDETGAVPTRYPAYLPTWDKMWFDPMPEFEFDDPALRVLDKSKPNLLREGVQIEHVQAHMGSIVHGVQLNKLSQAAKDELALLVCERKVVAFPDQDLMDDGPAAQQEFMSYFGKPNYQPVSGTVRGHPGFHIIHRNGNKQEIQDFLEEKASTLLWHQDVSYEHQPPGYVMLGQLEGPDVGGDTVFAATDKAYQRLSPTFASLLDGLKATHTSAKMIAHVRAAGGLVRKDPVESLHPLVRVHPVTGERCLFLNLEFITRIKGMKETESKMILEFLLNHLITGHDFQVRMRWKPRTMVMFDNRSTIHSAIVDYFNEEGGCKPRHMFRLCAMAEKPIPVAE